MLKAKGLDVNGKNWKKANVQVTTGRHVTSTQPRREIRNVGSDQRRPHHHRGRRLRRRRLRRRRADLPDRRVARRQQADRVIDASGKYVLPGCIDPHTHLDMPFGGTVTIDDVESGQTVGGVRRDDHATSTSSSSRRARPSARRSTTWQCEGRGQAGDRHGLPHGGHRPEARAARSRSSRRCPTRASRPTSSSWPTRARSWSTTRRSSARCRSRRRPARS